LTTLEVRFGHIFTAHAQKRLFRSFRSKIWPSHSLRRPQFPIRQMYYNYRVALRDIFDVFCYYVTWPCDLDLLSLRVSYTVLLMSDPHTNFDNATTIGYW